MKYALAAIGSITMAVRLKKAMGSNASQVVHTPSVINRGGCSYSLRFSEELMPVVAKIAGENNITIKKFYIEEINGREREYHALS